MLDCVLMSTLANYAGRQRWRLEITRWPLIYGTGCLHGQMETEEWLGEEPATRAMKKSVDGIVVG